MHASLTSVHVQGCQKHAQCWWVSSRLPAECSAAKPSFFPPASDAVVAAAPQRPEAAVKTCCHRHVSSEMYDASLNWQNYATYRRNVASSNGLYVCTTLPETNGKPWQINWIVCKYFYDKRKCVARTCHFAPTPTFARYLADNIWYRIQAKIHAKTRENTMKAVNRTPMTM